MCRCPFLLYQRQRVADPGLHLLQRELDRLGHRHLRWRRRHPRPRRFGIRVRRDLLLFENQTGVGTVNASGVVTSWDFAINGLSIEGGYDLKLTDNGPSGIRLGRPLTLKGDPGVHTERVME